MPDAKPIRDTILTIRITSDLKDAIATAADRDGRTMSQWVERTVMAQLRKQGLWKN